ncbi:hypothetical protein [Butyrivibrio sp. XPD2006]|jgi:hypothetical protein|uniref:hypothetical protein n=1 Tax=Butyrivibrio sp. XPD2006 TaxID=1280668 RepID=UPI0003B3CCC3|nr:hypothetical protein [Butyrivibrio sp. XPD2006]
MKGRQTIKINRSMTPDDILHFMEAHWDRENMSEFGTTTKRNGDLEYIVLPATENWDVIIYPKEAGGLFNKDNKLVMCAARASHAIDPSKVDYTKYFRRSKDAFDKIKDSKEAIDLNAEMMGPCEDALQEYTGFMKKLLEENGYL